MGIKTNFSEDCQRMKDREEQREEDPGRERANGGRSVLPSDRRFRCFACLQNEKPKTRRASEIPPRLCCENCIHYKQSAARGGTENAAGSYMRVCCMCVTQEIGRTCASMCVYVCVYAVCLRLPKIVI